ncbi:hypothetical protein Pst134EA_011370 [Puccinia striiformis f. sp. tritici]|uniref:hypothetical protein n=1 Tax=Puccinia striiformis f. sp. tritici TaxID=168172 RepID=UPI00200758AB|nr:hypothetical protein Pst134EA_011370 [Puccinia striiformis f. sp. tritici]KAH9467742.1 hypothetical protein Pst134EA_011370 [Puccinia striiformis f. sp. tritici]
MVSLAYLITLLSVMVAVSRAEDVAATKSEDVDSKWLGGFGGYRNYGIMNSFGGLNLINNMGLWGSPWINNWANSLGGCYGAAIFQPSFGLNSMYFAKATDEAQSVSRRAIHLDAEQLFRPSDDSPTNRRFPSSMAAQTLHEKNVSTAQSGNCKLSLVSSKEKVVAKQVSGQTLQKAASSILGTCGTKGSQPQSNKPAQVNGKQVAILLSRA